MLGKERALDAPLNGDWRGVADVPAENFTCGHCGWNVAPAKGWNTAANVEVDDHQVATGRIRICHRCNRPTFIQATPPMQVPGVSPGQDVDELPTDIEALYLEARRSAGASAYTASVLACRKLLMNIAVSKDARPDQSFVKYIEYLAEQGYVPPGGEGWVDHIRKRGNEATHEIRLMNDDDATELLLFAEMLLRFVYEFPARVPASTTPVQDTEGGDAQDSDGSK